MRNPKTGEEEELGRKYFDDRCPKRQESARKAANTKAYDDVPTRRDLTFGQRLTMGFEMLSDDPADADDEEE